MYVQVRPAAGRRLGRGSTRRLGAVLAPLAEERELLGAKRT